MIKNNCSWEMFDKTVLQNDLSETKKKKENSRFFFQ